MNLTHGWQKEPGPRLQGSRDLDCSKLQAPCVVSLPSGGWRMFYTAVGPAKPFPLCQGYILSAFSDDGLGFRPDPGIRLMPQPNVLTMSRRVMAPAVTLLADGRWRMYFESRGTADVPTVICSAISHDMLEWKLEEGIRMQGVSNVRAPRYLPLPDGRGRLYFIASERRSDGNSPGKRIPQNVVSAITSDGLHFTLEPGYRMPNHQTKSDTAGITAGEAVPPAGPGDRWTLFYSVWQDVAPGTAVPIHPSKAPGGMDAALSENFAAASIAADMSGYRSRILAATSSDGLAWKGDQCVIEGDGYGKEGLDAVHAEDMSLVAIGGGRYRMYYAACDKAGNWRIASAISTA